MKKMVKWIEQRNTWLKKQWVDVGVFFLGGVAFVIVLYLLGAMAKLLIECPPDWLWGLEFLDASKECSESKIPDTDIVEVLKVMLLVLGGLGGLYGLVIAARRAQNAQIQLFNERLGRGVELLAHRQETIRASGVRILDNLAKSSNKKDVTLIVEILYSYVNTKAEIEADESIQNRPQKPKRYIDIELAIKAVSQHAKKTGIPFYELGFSRLDLRFLACEKSNLTGVCFWFSNITSGFFWRANLTEVQLQNAILTHAVFREADLTYAVLSGADLSKADMAEANLSKADMTEANLHDIKNMTQEQFDQIIYEQGKPPKNIPYDLYLPDDRAYIKAKDDTRQFVKSDKAWSGQDVDDYPDELWDD